MRTIDYLSIISDKTNKKINSSIYCMYKELDYINKKICEYDIKFLIKNIFPSIVIEEAELLSNDEFNKQLVQKYKKCIVSGNDIIECEPVCIVSDFYHMDNGLLLNKSLSQLYKSYYWAINPYTLRIETSSMAKNKQVSCNLYENMKLDIDMNNNTFLNLLCHYNKFKKQEEKNKTTPDYELFNAIASNVTFN